MDLKMEVYTPGLELLGLLEVQNSVIWESKAFGAGSFSVTSLLTADTRPLLAAENIIWIAGGDAGVIEYINQEAEDRTNITVKGCNLTGLLERRILWGRYDLTGTPPQIMHYLVNECAVNPTRGDVQARKIPGLVLLDPPAGGASIRVQRTGGNLLEVLEELGATYGVAFGIRFNPAVPQMEFWTRWGVNRSIRQNANDPVFYSTELDDVLSSEYTYNSQDYRNVALIAGEGEGNDRVMVTVEGEDETYVPDVPTPEPTPEKYTITLSVDPSGSGIATGGGTVDGGTSITVTAAPAQKYGFVGWRENGAIVSTEPAYTFTVNRNRTLTAVFVSTVVMYTVTATIDPSGAGTVTGAGQYQDGAQATITAAPAEGYTFNGWAENGATVSMSESYTFSVTGNRAFVAGFAEVPQYEAGVDWFESNMPIAAKWYRAAYGGGKFVAVATGGARISAYTSDGINWTQETLPSNATWTNLTYGNGVFVTMVYSSSSAAYSLDGITWNPITLPVKDRWRDLAYGNGKFVAVADNSKQVVYSENGIDWMTSNLPSSSYWYCIAYGNGKFVAFSKAAYEKKAAYSEDGANWTAITPLSAASWQSITFGGGKFVVIAENSNKVAYSEDGVLWSESMMPSTAQWKSVIYGSGKFVAVASGSNKFAYSDDGISWNEGTLPLAAKWESVSYGNGRFVAVAMESDKSTYSSSDGPAI